MTQKQKKEKGKRNPFWNAVYWISLLLFVVLVGVIGYIVYGYWSADKGYEEISNTAFDDSAVSDPQRDLPEDELAAMVVDWDYLRSINPDIVAWVYMPGTRINYPVVQGDTNDEYLHRDFSYDEGFTARGGAIFMDAANSPEFTDDVTHIYGHHMNDGSMFACLSTQLQDQAEFDAHPYIYVLTPAFNYKCRPFSLMLSTGYEEIVRINFDDYQDRINYLTDIIDRSVVTPAEGKMNPEAVGQVFAFSTCDYYQYNARALMFSTVVGQSVPYSNSDDKITSEQQTEAQRAVE